MARQVAYARATRAEGKLLQIDGGDALFASAEIPAAQREQARARAELIAAAAVRSGLDAYLPGPSDLALGTPFLDGLAGEAGLPIVASNLIRQRSGRLAYRGHAARSVPGGRVLILGLIDPATWPPRSGLDATDPVTAARRLLKRRARPGDLVVLVAGFSVERCLELARALPEVDLVLSAQRGMLSFLPRELPRPGPQPSPDGAGVPVVAAGLEGQFLARFDVWRVGGDATLRGGALFEDAREQREQALKKLSRQPADPAASRQLAEADGLLELQRGRTRYRYQLLELTPELAEDPVIARRRQRLAR